MDGLTKVRKAQAIIKSGRKSAASQQSLERLAYNHPEYDIRLDPCRGLFNELYWEENDQPLSQSAMKNFRLQKRNLFGAYHTIKASKARDPLTDSPLDEKFIQARNERTTAVKDSSR